MHDTLRKLMALLEREDKRRFWTLLVAISAMALFQVVGIAAILPFMRLAAEPDLLSESELLRWLYDAGGFNSEKAFLVACGLAVLALFALSTAFSAFTTWLTQRYVWQVAHRICMRLLRSYTRASYEFFLQNHSTTLMKKAIADVRDLVTGVLLAGTQIIAYSFLSLVIFGLLLLVHPRLALVALGIFGGAYAVIHILLHRYLERLGRQRLEVVRRRFRSFMDTLSGMKAIKTEGVAPFFVQRFEAASLVFTDLTPKYELRLLTPRHLVDFLGFGGILTVIVYLLLTDADLLAAIPVLSVFAMASYRLLPALNKTFVNAARLSHHLPVIDELYADIHRTPAASETTVDDRGTAIAFHDEIRFREVTFRYQGTEAPVVHDVDLRIPRGSRVALVGSTGSGKSTLVDILVGLLWPQRGELSVDGVAITADNVEAWRRRIGYVPQTVFLFDDSIARNIAFGLADEEIDRERLRAAARMAQIDGFVSRKLPDGYDTVIGEHGARLSGGQRQRLGLARALYREPDVLILDEATSAVDGITEEAILSTLASERTDLTVVMVAHRLSTVRFCRPIHLLASGRVVEQGSYDELLSSSAEFRQMVQASS